jgi:hypothetical protein
MPSVPTWSTQIDVNITGSASTVTALKNGNSVAVWTFDAGVSSGTHIYARLVGSDGGVTTPSFRVEGTGFATQSNPSVASIDDDTFIITWQDDQTTSTRAIVYDVQPDGTVKARGAAFELATPPSPDNHANPSITALADGKFAIAVTGNILGITTNAAATYVYDGTGKLIGTTEFATGSFGAPGQALDTAVAKLQDGGAYVTVTSNSYAGPQNQTRYKVTAGVYSAVNNSEIKLIDITINNTAVPEFAVTTLKDGRFIVAWTTDGRVLAKIYKADGTESKALFNLDAGSNAGITKIAIQATESGFALAFQQGDDVFAQTYNVSGQDVAVRSTAIMAHAADSSLQTSPSISVLADGRFIVNWSDAAGVHGRIFDDRQALLWQLHQRA